MPETSAAFEARVPQTAEVAPDFQLLDSTGEPQQLSKLTAERSLALIFYRGYW